MSIKSSRLMVLSNEKIDNNVYELVLVGGDFSCVEYGQFINIAIPGYTLRRPFSVANFTDEKILITYKVVGGGTDRLSQYKHGELLDVLYGLGVGFNEVSDKAVTLIGGGIGVAPLYGWYEYLIKRGYDVRVILGFRNESESIYLDKFKNLEVVYDVEDGRKSKWI